MAVGIGVYGDFQRGMTKSRTTNSISSDDIGVAGGLLLDTNVANDSLFNYRLRLGAGRNWASMEPQTRASIIQTFGVSPAQLRSEGARFWFGPRIGLHYIRMEYAASPDLESFGFIPMALLPIFLMNDNITMEAFKVDIGLVLAGFNFNFGRYITLSFEMGLDYGFTVGKTKSDLFRTKREVSGEGLEGFATMAVIFRINDTYTAKPNEAYTTDTGKKINIEVQ